MNALISYSSNPLCTAMIYCAASLRQIDWKRSYKENKERLLRLRLRRDLFGSESGVDEALVIVFASLFVFAGQTENFAWRVVMDS